MKKATLPLKIAVFSLLFPLISPAQYFWDAGFSTGVSNYLGDMGGNELTRRDFVSDMKIDQTRFSVGGYARFRLLRNVSIKANLNWARISGDDKLSSNPGRNARNLNFRNDVIQLTAQAQYFFYTVNDLGHTYKHKDSFRSYIGIGAGAAYHNPKTSYQGTWVPLRPLETENVRYTKITAVIPASVGFCFTFNKIWRIGWDLTWNTTFTDYLDDVSTRYADPSTLSSPLAVTLANRTGELPGIAPSFAENFTPGSKRGDASHNDSYLSSTVEFGYVIRGHSNGRPIHIWVKERQRKDGNTPHRHRGILTRKIRVHW
jgi:hypothetical protein